MPVEHTANIDNFLITQVLSLVFHRPELDLHHASCHSPAVTFTHAAGRMLLKTVHWAVSVVWYMSVLLALHQVVT